MSRNKNKINLSDYSFVDMEDGSVLSTNLVLIKEPSNDEEAQELYTNSGLAFDYALNNGVHVGNVINTLIKMLSKKNQALVDLETGTIIGTNVALIDIPEDEDKAEELYSSDSLAIEFGLKHGTALEAIISTIEN